MLQCKEVSGVSATGEKDAVVASELHRVMLGHVAEQQLQPVSGQSLFAHLKH